MARTLQWLGPRKGTFIAAEVVSVMSIIAAITGCVGAGKRDVVQIASPTRQPLVGVHPHGQYLAGALFTIAKAAGKRDHALHGILFGSADVVLSVPVVGELAVRLLARFLSSRTVGRLLNVGRTVSLSLDRVHEETSTDSKQERCFFPANLGFVQQAIKQGVPLQPAYSFGTNSVCHMGRLVEAGPADPCPTYAHVKEVFRAYCVELRRVFNEHKYDVLPPDVAARGLQIIWRGHEFEDLSEEGLAKFGMSFAKVSKVRSTRSWIRQNLPAGFSYAFG